MQIKFAHVADAHLGAWHKDTMARIISIQRISTNAFLLSNATTLQYRGIS